MKKKSNVTFRIDSGTLYSAPPLSLKPHGMDELSLVRTTCMLESYKMS